MNNVGKYVWLGVKETLVGILGKAVTLIFNMQGCFLIAEEISLGTFTLLYMSVCLNWERLWALEFPWHGIVLHIQTRVCAHCAKQGIFVYVQSLEELCAGEQSPVSYSTFDTLCNEFPFSEILPLQVPLCSRTTAWGRLPGK